MQAKTSITNFSDSKAVNTNLEQQIKKTYWKNYHGT